MAKNKITAVLGPTNTGKTFLAIETMLSFDSGMIGFPLRLLAREVYDKIIKKINTSKVALITGSPNKNTSIIKTIVKKNKRIKLDHFVRVKNQKFNPNFKQFWESPYELIIFDNYPIQPLSQNFTRILAKKIITNQAGFMHITGPNQSIESLNRINSILGVDLADLDQTPKKVFWDFIEGNNNDFDFPIPDGYAAYVFDYEGPIPSKEFYEPFGQLTYWERQEIDVELEAPGTYYLAVFDKKGDTGKLALAIGYVEDFSGDDFLTVLPNAWIESRYFSEDFTPLVIFIVVIIGILSLIGFLIYRKLLSR